MEFDPEVEVVVMVVPTVRLLPTLRVPSAVELDARPEAVVAFVAFVADVAEFAEFAEVAVVAFPLRLPVMIPFCRVTPPITLEVDVDE
jgi:hypothetical protein